jgi:NADH dehydrogenase
VKASPAGRWLGVEADCAGRFGVEPDLSVPGMNGIYALGDTALSLGENNTPLPGL